MSERTARLPLVRLHTLAAALNLSAVRRCETSVERRIYFWHLDRGVRYFYTSSEHTHSMRVMSMRVMITCFACIHAIRMEVRAGLNTLPTPLRGLKHQAPFSGLPWCIVHTLTFKINCAEPGFYC